MTDETKTPITNIVAPYGRKIRLEDVRFESGMRLMRVTIREGYRITTFDIDVETATEWARVMQGWAKETGAS